jgi:hemoglobin/transferrin/lactoferrin receptor protein
VYGQNKYALNPVIDIDFGLRWNYMAADANKVRDPSTHKSVQLNANWQNWVANLRMNYQLTPNKASLFIGLSQGFRAPNLSDLTRFDSARSNEFEIASPDLEPEHYLTLDTGLKYRSESIDYDISLYYTSINDQIQRVPTGFQNEEGEFEITKVNLGDGYAYGGELDLNYKINKQLYVVASLSYINGKVDTFPNSSPIIEREYLSRLMPTNGRVALHYTANTEDWWLSTEVISFAKAGRLSTRDHSDTQRIPPNGSPAYTIININTGYIYSEQLQLTFHIQNILDEDYRVHGSGQNEAGVNIIGSIRYSF